MPEHSFEKLPDYDKPLMSDPTLIRNDDRIPPGYSLFRREVRLLNGITEPAFYSTREDQTSDPQAWERSSSSIIEGFTWALQVPEFADHETEDDDRTQEIGNMMSYAMSQGLTEGQVLECYKQAFAASRESIEAFRSKLHELLPGLEFEETAEMLEARTAVLGALAKHDQDPNFLRSVWVEYAKVCEQTVDRRTSSNTDPQIRAALQVAVLVHKALIFREFGELRRYAEDLTDAEEYALTKHLDELAEAIGIELDNLQL